MNFNFLLCFAFQISEVLSFRTADLSMFGSCVVHVKRFRDTVVFKDLTSIIIFAQVTRRYILFTVTNASSVSPQIQPLGSVREDCSLNVVMGIFPTDSLPLYYFMFGSGYTFNSNPFSIYIIVVGPSAAPVLVQPSSVILPASILVLKIPTNPFDAVALNLEPRFLYICIRCSVSVQVVLDNTNIRSISDLSYESNWVNSKLVLQGIVLGVMGDIRWCEKYLWEMWLSRVGHSSRNVYKYCGKSFAFTDILARSVHHNLSVFLTTGPDLSQVGFSGCFFYGLWVTGTPIEPWRSSGVYFHVPASSTITYCDCERGLETISFWSWLNCFDGDIWTCIFIVTALIHSYVILQHYFISRKCNLHLYISFGVDVIGIVIRQGSCKFCIIALFSIGIFIVSTLFENSLTSGLIVSTAERELQLSELIESGYRILYTGNSIAFGSQLVYVKKLFNLSNVYLREENLQLLTTEAWDDPQSFSTRKLAYFAFVTPAGAESARQTIQSKVSYSSDCSCRIIGNKALSFPIYSSYLHQLKFRIFHVRELLLQAGIDNLFDQDLGHTSADLNKAGIGKLETRTNENSFLSLHNLVPLFTSASVLAGISAFVFLIEAMKDLLFHNVGTRCCRARSAK
jgi:hypothetical protein